MVLACRPSILIVGSLWLRRERQTENGPMTPGETDRKRPYDPTNKPPHKAVPSQLDVHLLEKVNRYLDQGFVSFQCVCVSVIAGYYRFKEPVFCLSVPMAVSSSAEWRYEMSGWCGWLGCSFISTTYRPVFMITDRNSSIPALEAAARPEHAYYIKLIHSCIRVFGRATRVTGSLVQRVTGSLVQLRSLASGRCHRVVPAAGCPLSSRLVSRTATGQVGGASGSRPAGRGQWVGPRLMTWRNRAGGASPSGWEPCRATAADHSDGSRSSRVYLWLFDAYGKRNGQHLIQLNRN